MYLVGSIFVNENFYFYKKACKIFLIPPKRVSVNCGHWFLLHAHCSNSLRLSMTSGPHLLMIPLVICCFFYAYRFNKLQWSMTGREYCLEKREYKIISTNTCTDRWWLSILYYILEMLQPFYFALTTPISGKIALLKWVEAKKNKVNRGKSYYWANMTTLTKL